MMDTTSNEHIDSEMYKLEVNLDDISPEWLGHLMDKLLSEGARDVYYVPIYMKKNRPAVMLQLLCRNEDFEKIKQILFKETTTLGVRYYPLSVHRLERRFYKLETKWGTVTMKEGLLEGEVVQVAPEYEDCKRLAKANNVPLKIVYQEVWRNVT
ncbi:nickel insertion protein [Halalkalibacterium ligniniphilum]|uniref:nickel insertion protein n=1 Tax=Halalkalibacterium ligniniphilum TaxID=1134413 RepID=UPI000348048C|nr:nickel insertion protein [Halalkalibacterium ligniniphilum]